MNFLPENYEAPKSSNHYMKLQDGDNKIRILSQPVIGWEDWKDNKPVRFRFNEKPKASFDPKKPIKHFWAFIVWNHNEEQIQILHVTQATVRNFIESLCKDQDWGAPYFYDIKIIRKGESINTEYMVNPLPHKPVDEYIKKCFYERRINLEAIFTNEDPFAAGQDSYTEGVFEKPSTDKPAKNTHVLCISKEDAKQLDDIFKQCDPKYVEKVIAMLKKDGIDALERIPVSMFDRVKKAAIIRRDEYMANINQDMFAVSK